MQTLINDENYILAIRLKHPERFREIFGETIAELAHEDLTHCIQKLSETLLQRYRLQGPVASTSFGRWHVLFSAKASRMNPDMSEQIPLLREVGAAKMRELLTNNLGQATGCRQEYHFLILPAPGRAAEKSIERAIDRALADAGVADDRMPDKDSIERLGALIDDGGLQCVFQPVVSLAAEKVVGYEALTRGPDGTPFQSADVLFTAARRGGLTRKIEMACLEMALKWLPDIPSQFWISVNLGPDLLTSEEFRRHIEHPDILPLLPRVVFELTEHLPLESAVRLRDALEGLKEKGLRLSLDDTGCGFFDLTTVRELRPEIVKLCITVISRIGRSDGVEREMYKTIQSISRMGGITLGEGVEREEQAQVLKRCGAALAQGNLYGIPLPAETLFGKI
ncbi:MAG: EAL domain-containing protein [Gammaproteobacteria bacterium]